ncbi:prepilin-type N-terminal cleavage/methylation domain-containing protein [Bacillus oleivorans]|uniref:Prepilin-type N-terminal cleavage/methylation domain-containing protein n=1 Tax=Bacillus oleivorans TaxID=1448271 RepID=A0A285CWW8_9BACI|nr:prepilin-type N-terminal cleavage/methylation domain-containing protein [Bacillus oleivorans]SNX71536.1 prepilin-type N-terminal cleavage/methylation domain-containing protein [Bacillus oleivorans]
MRTIIKNEKGLTLIELLGAIAIFGIVITVIFSFFSFGANGYQKGEMMVRLQNEANRIMTALTVAYYSEGNFTVESGDENGDGRADITLNGAVISDTTLLYSLSPEEITSNDEPVELVLTVTDLMNPAEAITLKTYLRSVRNHAISNP